jgi:hypothetical protein
LKKSGRVLLSDRRNCRETLQIKCIRKEGMQSAYSKGNSRELSSHLVADDNTVAAGGAALVAGLLIRGAALGVGESAAGSTAVELDAVARAGDAEAFAWADAGGAGDAWWAGAGGAAGAGQGWNVRFGVGVVVRWVLVVEVGISKALGEFINGDVAVTLDDMGGLNWVVWLWGLDLGWGAWATDWDIAGNTAGAARAALLCAWGLGLGSWDIKDVELALGGWLEDGLVGWVVCAVVPIHDVVVPVSLTGLHGTSGEAEGASPVTSGLGSGDGEGKLALVVVPWSEKMDCFALWGGSEGEFELDGRHDDCGFGGKFVGAGE